jgi:alpha-galactosidase
MPIEYDRVFEIGDMTVRFPVDAGRVGLELYPTALKHLLAWRRLSLRGEFYIDLLPGDFSWPAFVVESLAQVKIAGEPYPGAFATGHTMRSSPAANAFLLDGQRTERDGEMSRIITTVKHPAGHWIEHRLRWRTGDRAIEVSTEFFNGSGAPVTLEMLASFALGGITPFAPDDATGRLRVHRFRSGWSAEGRLETRTIEQLHLERSWSGAGAFSERFGQLGTMPVRKWFPFVAAEDTEAGVVWGAQLAWAGTWQMEVFRQNDDLCLSGGIGDREFGHWMKRLAPGESLATPAAWISCVHGSLDDLCDRLTAVQNRAADMQPEVEREMPIVFNEWCTTWGDPRHEKVVAIADRLRVSPVRYLVIDAGWYKAEGSDWSSGHGDWIPSPKLFPGGIAATARAIRERGLIPGLWFEMETVGSQSAAFSLVDHMLKRDGQPITVRERRFWDLNDPAAIEYLTEKVIDLLESAGFGYLKVDYNETAGMGCDHPDSQGEGLRGQVLGTYRFFEKIRERLPDLVIENCASGGHRLEPSMLGRTAMSSFSDAHELVEIPIIAANLHRLMLPRQSQIWAVLHASDSDRRLVYSLAATFLGRMCISGEITGLSDAQWGLVVRMEGLYGKAAPIIKYGRSRRFGVMGESWRHPTGWQAVVYTGIGRALVVVHTFAGPPASIHVPLPEGGWSVEEALPGPELEGGSLVWNYAEPFSASVVLLSEDT